MRGDVENSGMDGDVGDGDVRDGSRMSMFLQADRCISSAEE